MNFASPVQLPLKQAAANETCTNTGMKESQALILI
jgi:hypothetical protein